MEKYYNQKIQQCNRFQSLNNDKANTLMENVDRINKNARYPPISELVKIDSNLRSILDNFLSNAEMSACAGAVDVKIDEIKQLANHAKDLVSDIADVAEVALNTMCISMGVIGSICSPACGATIGATCAVSAVLVNEAIDEAVDATT